MSKSFDYSIIDFETASENMDSACSIGIVCVKNSDIIHSYYTLINPKCEFSNINININGISSAMIIGYPEFCDIIFEIEEIIKKSDYIVAHNAQFDMSVLKCELDRCQSNIDDFKYFDSISFLNKQSKGIGSSLADKAEYFEVINIKAHNALSDANTVAKAMIKAIERSRFKSFQSYIKGYPNIKIKRFSELNPNKLFKKKYNTVKISDLNWNDSTNHDLENELYGKIVVLTGDFYKLPKKDIMQKIVNLGGVIKSSVSRKTDYLFVGQQDIKIVGSDGMSNKEEKAYLLKENGEEIEILDQEELYRILDLDN